MVKIFNLADTDMIVCDAESGLNDYSKNLKFTDKLDDILKHLVGLSQECCEKANAIRQKVADAKEDKRLIQDIVHLHDVVKESEKDPFVSERNKEPIDWVHTNEFRGKREKSRMVTLWESSDEEDNQLPGDPDTKFKFPKQNENDEIRFSQHICIECDKTLRDSYELRNHMSNHHRELYRCVKCPEDIFRSEASYEQHHRTHMGIMFKCSDCAAVFDRKSTLTNHAFTHTQSLLTCQKCAKQFKFRSTYLEHITYRHRKNKSVECPICHKMFWTPTSMQSHCNKQHGTVAKLVYDKEDKWTYVHALTCDFLLLDPVQQVWQFGYKLEVERLFYYSCKSDKSASRTFILLLLHLSILQSYSIYYLKRSFSTVN